MSKSSKNKNEPEKEKQKEAESADNDSNVSATDSDMPAAEAPDGETKESEDTGGEVVKEAFAEESTEDVILAPESDKKVAAVVSPKKDSGDSKEPESDSRITFVVGIIILILVLGAFFFRQSGNRDTGSSRLQTEVQTQEGSEVSEEKVNYAAEAITLVREEVGPKSNVTMEERLKHFKEKRIQDKPELKISHEEWRAVPAAGVEEADRYFDVSSYWKEDDSIVVLQWRVDLKNKTITPINEAAQEMVKFEDYLLTKIDKPGDNIADPTPVGTPGVNVEDIDILPPPASVDVPPSPVRNVGTVTVPHKAYDPVDIPLPLDMPEEAPFELAGVMSSGGKHTAMLQKDGRVYNASVGDRLPDGWVVSEVGNRTITLRKGNSRQTLKMKEASVPPAKSPATPGHGGSGLIPGDAPPIPPGPGGGIPHPDTGPTIIPLN
jgi:hypothetical protein